MVRRSTPLVVGDPAGAPEHGLAGQTGPLAGGAMGGLSTFDMDLLYNVQ